MDSKNQIKVHTPPWTEMLQIIMNLDKVLPDDEKQKLAVAIRKCIDENPNPNAPSLEIHNGYK